MEYIKIMIEELLEAKRKFEEDRAAAQAEYEANIERMKAEYDQVIIFYSNKNFNLGHSVTWCVDTLCYTWTSKNKCYKV